MDHVGIIKRAWEITWKYKALWILGLFVGGGGGGGGGSNFGSRGSGNGADLSRQFGGGEQALRWLEANLVAIVVVATVLVLIGLIWWVLAIAAHGGLIWMSNEAAEGRRRRAMEGWGTGFHFWGRTFLIGLVLALPLIVIALVIGALFAGTIVAVIAGAQGAQNAGGAAAAGVLGICGLVAVAIIVIVPLAILIGVLFELALRHGVLEDMRTGDAIRAAWHDVRQRFKDVALMWLVLLGIGIVYGIVVGIAAVVVVVPIVGAAVVGAWPLSVVLGLVLFAALLFVGAIYSSFFSTSWTVFFRRLTGREAVPAPAPAFAGGYPPPPPPSGHPQPPQG